MMWKLLILAGCLVTGGLGRPDVSHLLRKPTADKQKRQNFISTSVTADGDGVVRTEIKTGDAANVESLLPQIGLFPLQDNQPSPFRRLEERPGYDYQKPDFPLDVHPDSNLVSPVSTQAPEYLPPQDGEESSNVDQFAPSSSPTAATTTTTTTTTTSSTTTTTTPAPYTTGVSTTQQEFDNNDGYGYRKPEVMLPTNINEVIGEPNDINLLATTTVATTTTTAKNSLEYLPPKPLPDLVVPKQPATTTTTATQAPAETSTTYQQPDTKLPEASIYPDASGTYSTAVTQQTTTSTELPSTSAPEYLPPDSDTSGFQIIVRSGIDSEDTATTAGSTTNLSVEPSTTLVPERALPDADSLVQQEQDVTTTGAPEPSTTTVTVAPGEPLDDTSSVIALINQMQETGRVASQGDFVPELRIDEETTTTGGASEVTTLPSSTGTAAPSSLAPTTDPTDPPEARFGGEDDTTGPTSLLDLLTPTTTVGSVTQQQNDTITTYRPTAASSSSDEATTALVTESSADETELQARIADPNDGYNYEAPENGLTVPSSVVPSHTLEADGYHYKVPAVPFP